MKFFSRLFSDKDSNAASDGSDPEAVDRHDAPTPPPPPAPPPPVPVPAIASCDSRPIDIAGAERRTIAAPPIVTPPMPRGETRSAAPSTTPTRARARTPVGVAAARKNPVTTVTMPPSPATSSTPRRADPDKPLFSAPSSTTGTKAPPLAVPPSTATSKVAAAVPPTTTAAAKPATTTTTTPRRRRTRPSIEKPAESAAELFGEIDAAIDGAQETEDKPVVEGKLANDAKTELEVRALFGRIAAHHVTHVRDFVIELGLAPAAKSWLAICRPAVASLRRAADRIHFSALVEATDVFASALGEAERSPGGFIEGRERDDILMRYRALEKVLPEAFDVAPTQNRREPIVMHALLGKVNGLGSLGIHRMYSAGVMNLAALYRARVDDLASATGIEAPLCAAILDEVQRYRRTRAEQAPEADHARERGRLRELLDSLTDCETRFRAADAAEDRTAKRRIRRQRDALIRELDLVLAHLGELDLVTEMASTSIAGRIRRIDGWLRELPARLTQNRAHA